MEQSGREAILRQCFVTFGKGADEFGGFARRDRDGIDIIRVKIVHDEDVLVASGGCNRITSREVGCDQILEFWIGMDIIGSNDVDANIMDGTAGRRWFWFRFWYRFRFRRMDVLTDHIEMPEFCRFGFG